MSNPAGPSSAFSVSGVTTTSLQRTDTSFLGSLACSEASLDTMETFYPDSGYQSRSLRYTEEEQKEDEQEREEDEWEEEGEEEFEEERVVVSNDNTSWSDEESDQDEPPAPSYSTGLVWSVHHACAHQ